MVIPYSIEKALAGLNDETSVLQTLITCGEDLFVISIDGMWTLREATAREGPIEVGFCHGDLSATEVTESLNAEQQDPDDIIQNERARRPVRRAGQFRVFDTEEMLPTHGDMLRTGCKFSVGDGHTVNCFIANRSGGSLTTGAIVEVNGNIYGRWQR